MKIALINKVPIYRSGMAFFLRGELPHETEIIESESVSRLQADGPLDIDLIIMATEQMSDMLVVPSILEAKKNYPFSKLIMVGKKESPSSIISYFSLGVLGYVDNEAALSELTRCVENVEAGKKFVNLDLLWTLASEARFQTGFDETKRILTRREYRIAQCLMEGKRVTWIARELNLKPSTISTVKATIFKKLGVSDIIKLKDKLEDLDRLGDERSAKPVLDS